MGLRNASELVYDVFSKDLNSIKPPFLTNLKFSKFALTGELLRYGSFGIDPDNFCVNDPTFYVNEKQLAKYCQDSGQELSLYSTIEFPHNKVLSNT